MRVSRCISAEALSGKKIENLSGHFITHGKELEVDRVKGCLLVQFGNRTQVKIPGADAAGFPLDVLEGFPCSVHGRLVDG